MSLPHILLGMLRSGPKTGYELNKLFKTEIHYFWETDLSRIYRTLNEMKVKRWVDVEVVEQRDNPNKKVYSISRFGLAELKKWLAEPGKRDAARKRNVFLAQLHFSELIPIEDQIAVLERRREGLMDELAVLEWRAEDLEMPVPISEGALSSGVTRMMFSLEYGIRMHRCELAWNEDSLRVLRAAVQQEE